MSDYDAQIERDDASVLIPEDASREIIKSVVETNWLFGLARRLPDLPTSRKRMPVATALASAYFVDGDTGLKKTTKLDWANKYIDAEELAVIVPISQAVLDDSDYDIWGEVRPALVEAFNVAITEAVLHGINIPATWTTNVGEAGLVALCVDRGCVAPIDGFSDLYEAIMGESAAGESDGLLMLLETQGFQVSGHVAHMTMKGRVRNCRSGVTGQPLFQASAVANIPSEIDGAPIYFPKDGSLDADEALMISGDWSQLVYAMRQDLSWKLLDQAVITDAEGLVVYNLAQQDMVALRAVMRLGFALPNPMSRMATDDDTRCPFAILTATGS